MEVDAAMIVQSSGSGDRYRNWSSWSGDDEAPAVGRDLLLVNGGHQLRKSI